MNDEKLQDNLIKSNETDVKAVLVMKEKAKRRLMEEPSASNIAAFDRAVTLLKRLTERDQDQVDLTNQEIFKNRLDVWNYLEAEGWLVSKSGFYTHCKEGKLRPNTAGEYESKAIDKYAKTYLRRKDTGKKVSVQQEQLQEQKLKAEIKRLTAQAAKAEHELLIAEGKYIPREDVDLELVGRAIVLDSVLSNWIQTVAPDWIDLVKGDVKKISELIDSALAGKDAALNEFASKREYEIEIEE